LTFSCYRRLPLLCNDACRRLLAEALDRAVDRHRYRLVAYVFMPEHVHLIVYPLSGAPGVSDLLRAIKRPSSFRIKKLLQQDGSPLLAKLTIRQRPGVMSFRFWQEGPGYDRNLTEVKTTTSAIDYLHLNPVRRGLVKRAIDWQWSSARWYANEQETTALMIPTVHGLPADWLGDVQS